jgi:hypothetical protein
MLDMNCVMQMTNMQCASVVAASTWIKFNNFSITGGECDQQGEDKRGLVYSERSKHGHGGG